MLRRWWRWRGFWDLRRDRHQARLNIAEAQRSGWYRMPERIMLLKSIAMTTGCRTAVPFGQRYALRRAFAVRTLG